MGDEDTCTMGARGRRKGSSGLAGVHGAPSTEQTETSTSKGRNQQARYEAGKRAGRGCAEWRDDAHERGSGGGFDERRAFTSILKSARSSAKGRSLVA